MITQNDLEQFVLEGFLRDIFDQVNDHYTPAGDGIYMVYVNGSRQRDALLGELRDQRALAIVDSYPTNPETICYHLRFAQPPRIAYGAEPSALEAENARLRAAGRALLYKEVAGHTVCGECFAKVDAGESHAVDCPARVFAEGGE